MPYFNRYSADVPDWWRIRYPRFNPTETMGKASVRYTAFSTERRGENASKLDLSLLYNGKVSYNFYYKKQLVGTRPKRKYYNVYYRDDRGRTRRKRAYKVIQAPVYIRIPEVSSVAKMKDATVNKSRFLKPNKLFYTKTTNVVIPNEQLTAVQYTYDGGSSYSGTFLSSGCGVFVWPNSYDGVYRQIGFNNPLRINGIAVSQEQRDNALRKLYSRVNSAIPQYLTATAESPKLIKQLNSILKNGIKLFRAIKKLEFAAYTKDISAKATDIQGMWLGWIYGISPVVSDIQASIDLVKDSDRVWRSYKASDVKAVLTTPPFTDLITTRATQTTTSTAKYGVIIEGRLGFSEVQSSVLSFEELISTGYELIPFSFMLDWAVPIGDYLASASVFDGLKYHAWETAVMTIDRQAVGYHDRTVVYGPSDRQRQTSSTAEYHQYAFAVQRTPISVLPDLPDIKVNTPATDMTWFKRAINAAFIASVRTGGFKAPIR